MSMKSKTTKQFRALLAKLPKEIRRQARHAYRLFRENANHPSLQFKLVHRSEPIYSARINIDYRAVAIVDREVAVWFWIGSHSDYDKLLVHLR